MALYGDALWASGLFEEAEAQLPDALAVAPELARGHHGMARSLAARSQLDEAMNEAQAALRLVAARSRNPSHRRHDLRADAQVRGSGRRVRQLRQPAAEQGSQREGRLVARRNPVPAVVRPARAVRGRSRHRRQALHRRLPARERQGRRAREGQRRRRRRTSSSTPASENTVITRADGAAARRRADHLHAERRRRRRRAARPAAGAHRLARARLAEAAQRAVPHQEPAAARPADRRKPRACRRSRSATR